MFDYKYKGCVDPCGMNGNDEEACTLTTTTMAALTTTTTMTTGPATLSDANIEAAVKAWLDNPTTAADKYGRIENWDTSRVTDMYGLFRAARYFNDDIGDWDVSAVTDMRRMFSHASLFNQDIGDWDVSGVKDMRFMFDGAMQFNQDLGTWCESDHLAKSGIFMRNGCIAPYCGMNGNDEPQCWT